MKRLLTMMAAALLAVSVEAQVMMLSETHAMKRVDANQRYLLLPVQEKEEMAHVKVICQNQVVKELNVRLAVDHVDYVARHPVQRQPPLYGCRERLCMLAAHANQQRVRHYQPRAFPPSIPSHTSLGMDERPQRHVL